MLFRWFCFDFVWLGVLVSVTFNHSDKMLFSLGFEHYREMFNPFKGFHVFSATILPFLQNIYWAQSSSENAPPPPRLNVLKSQLMLKWNQEIVMLPSQNSVAL